MSVSVLCRCVCISVCMCQCTCLCMQKYQNAQRRPHLVVYTFSDCNFRVERWHDSEDGHPSRTQAADAGSNRHHCGCLCCHHRHHHRLLHCLQSQEDLQAQHVIRSSTAAYCSSGATGSGATDCTASWPGLMFGVQGGLFHFGRIDYTVSCSLFYSIG